MKKISTLRPLLTTLVRDVGHGMWLTTHSSLAMLGLCVAAVCLAFWLQPAWLASAEGSALAWLRERNVHVLLWLPEPDRERPIALRLNQVLPEQAAVADWLSRKYRVAPEPVAALVVEAKSVAKEVRLPAHLLLAVMAIESSFHPYAQSHAGAQGLMQVMGRVHAGRYDVHGGSHAAFVPAVNLRVGAEVLADAIRLKGGSVEGGLRAYLGATDGMDDGGYVAKVLAERVRLDQVAAGVDVAIN